VCQHRAHVEHLVVEFDADSRCRPLRPSNSENSTISRPGQAKRRAAGDDDRRNLRRNDRADDLAARRVIPLAMSMSL